MEKVAPGGENLPVNLESGRAAVEEIAEEGESGAGKMDADLVGAAGAGAGLHQGKSGSPRQGGKGGLGRLTAAGNGLDAAATPRFELIRHREGLGRTPGHEGKVDLAHLPLGKLPGQRVIGTGIEGEEENPGGVHIEAMQEDRCRGVSGILMQAGSDQIQGVDPSVSRGMAGEPGGLADGQEEVVTIEFAENGGRYGGRAPLEGDLNPIPSAETQGGAALRTAVDEDLAAVKSALHRLAGDAVEGPGEEEVEALPGLSGGDEDRFAAPGKEGAHGRTPIR
jgi:hypothetical protein